MMIGSVSGSAPTTEKTQRRATQAGTKKRPQKVPRTAQKGEQAQAQAQTQAPAPAPAQAQAQTQAQAQPLSLSSWAVSCICTATNSRSIDR